MKGLTLIELMISIALLTLILSTTAPGLGSAIDRHQANTAASTLKDVLNSARSHAFTSEISLTVCPTVNNQCANDWSNKIAVFNDANNDQIVDEDEYLYLQAKLNNAYGYWQKKRVNTPFVKFNAQGHAFTSATTFLFCLNSGYSSAAKQLIINFQGRIRLENYLNTRGKPFSTLAPLGCK